MDLGDDRREVFSAVLYKWEIDVGSFSTMV